MLHVRPLHWDSLRSLKGHKAERVDMSVCSKAEELMLMAKAGKSHPLGLQLVPAMPRGARGGTMYLVRTSTFQKEGGNDGYLWTEILHQSDLITTKENHLDYRHYYISTSLGDGRRTRTSSKFRREAYTMGDLTLVTYIGDEKEAMASEANPVKPPQPPVSLQVISVSQCRGHHCLCVRLQYC